MDMNLPDLGNLTLEVLWYKVYAEKVSNSLKVSYIRHGFS